MGVTNIVRKRSYRIVLLEWFRKNPWQVETLIRCQIRINNLTQQLPGRSQPSRLFLVCLPESSVYSAYDWMFRLKNVIVVPT